MTSRAEFASIRDGGKPKNCRHPRVAEAEEHRCPCAAASC